MKKLIDQYEVVQDRINRVLEAIEDDKELRSELRKQIAKELYAQHEKIIEVTSSSGKGYKIVKMSSRRCDYDRFEELAPDVYQKCVKATDNFQIRNVKRKG